MMVANRLRASAPPRLRASAPPRLRLERPLLQSIYFVNNRNQNSLDSGIDTTALHACGRPRLAVSAPDCRWRLAVGTTFAPASTAAAAVTRNPVGGCASRGGVRNRRIYPFDICLSGAGG